MIPFAEFDRLGLGASLQHRGTAEFEILDALGDQRTRIVAVQNRVIGAKSDPRAVAADPSRTGSMYCPLLVRDGAIQQRRLVSSSHGPAAPDHLRNDRADSRRLG